MDSKRRGTILSLHMIMYGAVFSNAVQYSLQRQDERFRPIYLTARELDEMGCSLPPESDSCDESELERLREHQSDIRRAFALVRPCRASLSTRA